MTDEPNSALLMFVAHRAAEARVLDALRAAGFDDLTLAQCRIGQRLNPDGIRVTDLAEQAGVTKQTAGALVDELEAQRLRHAQARPGRRRARLVVLSDRGDEAVRGGRRRGRAGRGANGERIWALRPMTELRAALVSLREITDPFHDCRYAGAVRRASTAPAPRSRCPGRRVRA